MWTNPCREAVSGQVGQLLGCQWPQNAELVALGVLHDDPRRFRSLPNGDLAGSQSLQPADLHNLIIRAQAHVQSVLQGFGLRYPQKEQIRHDANFGTIRRRFEGHLIWIIKSDSPADGFRPKHGQFVWLNRVDTHVLNSNAHGITVNGRGDVGFALVRIGHKKVVTPTTSRGKHER